jgi:hypothetical protein
MKYISLEEYGAVILEVFSMIRTEDSSNKWYIKLLGK